MACKFNPADKERKGSFLFRTILLIFLLLSFLCVLDLAAAAYGKGASEFTPVRVGVIHYPDDVYVSGKYLYNYDTEFMGRVAQFGKWDPRFVFSSNRKDLLNALKEGKIQIALGVDKPWGNEEHLIFFRSPIFCGDVSDCSA